MFSKRVRVRVFVGGVGGGGRCWHAWEETTQINLGVPCWFPGINRQKNKKIHNTELLAGWLCGVSGSTWGARLLCLSFIPHLESTALWDVIKGPGSSTHRELPPLPWEGLGVEGDLGTVWKMEGQAGVLGQDVRGTSAVPPQGQDSINGLWKPEMTLQIGPPQEEDQIKASVQSLRKHAGQLPMSKD